MGLSRVLLAVCVLAAAGQSRSSATRWPYESSRGSIALDGPFGTLVQRSSESATAPPCARVVWPVEPPIHPRKGDRDVVVDVPGAYRECVEPGGEPSPFATFQLLEPPDRAVLPRADAKTFRLALTWKGVRGVFHYRVRLSREETFERSFVSACVRLRWSYEVRDLPAGTYFWEVTALGPRTHGDIDNACGHEMLEAAAARFSIQTEPEPVPR